MLSGTLSMCCIAASLHMQRNRIMGLEPIRMEDWILCPFLCIKNECSIVFYDFSCVHIYLKCKECAHVRF